MKTIEEKFKNKFKQIKLKRKEKAFIEERLLLFMKANPILIKSPYSIKSPYLSIKMIRNIANPIKILALALILALTTGSGFAYAAENALPGNILYSIKTNINEEVRGLFLGSSEKKMVWEIEKTERRMEEAAELVITNKMTTKTSEEIKTRIDQHTKKISKEIKEIKNENPETALEISSQLESSINAHNTMLLAVKEKSDANGEITDIISKTQEKVDNMKGEKEELESIIINSEIINDQKSTIEDRIQKTEERVNKMQKTIDELSFPVSKTLVNNIDNRLEEIILLQEQVKKEIINEEYGKAFVSLQGVYQKSEELDMSIYLKDKFNVTDSEIEVEKEKITETIKIPIEPIENEDLNTEKLKLEIKEISLEEKVINKELGANIETNLAEIKELGKDIIPTKDRIVLLPEETELEGEIICLPYKETYKAKTKECAIGLLGTDSKYYQLIDNESDESVVEKLVLKQRIKVVGKFIPVNIESVYTVSGTIQIASLAIIIK